MKTIVTTFCFFLVALLTAQTTVRLETPKCRGNMQVFAMNGVGYVKKASLKKVKENTDGGEEKNVFTWTYDSSEPGIFFIGTSMRDYFPVLVGVDTEVLVEGECGRMNQVKIMGSPSNVAYQAMLRNLNQNNSNYSGLAQQYRTAKSKEDQAKMTEIATQMKSLDAKKKALVESTKAEDAYLGRIAAMNTYLSYVNADKAAYPSGLDHYLGTIWQFTDFKDAGYDGMNVVYEASANYANTLMSAMQPQDLEKVALAYAEKWPAGSKARMYAMGGMYGTLSSRSNLAALTIADRLIEEYKTKDPQAVASVSQSYNKLRTSTTGATAPDFSGPNPAGETIALSDLRGKVVLLDFWASWCGPCRRENPNVVKMYKKYADKGFEILGVSLDRDKARWEKAIADDGLTWLHVSDLKHWRSEYAGLYGVRSIPDTILLDAEGKIIARNLRGAQLEQRLAQIFGEGK